MLNHIPPNFNQLADLIPSDLKNILKNCNPVGNTAGCSSPPQKITDSPPTFDNLGDVLSGAFTLIIYVSFILMLIMMIAGALQYLFAGGNKDNLGKARKRITFAIIGFVIVIIAWLLQDFIHQVLAPTSINTPQFIQ